MDYCFRSVDHQDLTEAFRSNCPEAATVGMYFQEVEMSFEWNWRELTLSVHHHQRFRRVARLQQDPFEPRTMYQHPRLVDWSRRSILRTQRCKELSRQPACENDISWFASENEKEQNQIRVSEFRHSGMKHKKSKMAIIGRHSRQEYYVATWFKCRAHS
jgi:hypothetical protein